MQTIWDFYTGMGECSASGRYLPRVGHHLQAVTCLISTTQSEIINPRDRAHSVAGAWSNNLRFLIDNSSSMPPSEAKPHWWSGVESSYRDSVQDVVGGLGPDERVLAVAENARPGRPQRPADRGAEERRRHGRG